MIIKMKIPSPGESILEVEIADWLVEDGQYVDKDQAIAEIDSDKATLELPAEESGVIKILVESGEVVSVGEIVCTINTDAKKPKEKKEAIKKENQHSYEEKEEKQNNIDNNKNKTPLAESIINKHSIESEIKGSGNKGKITKSDALGSLPKNIAGDKKGATITKMSSLRRKIASRLVAVKNQTAMLTTFNEVDMTSIIDIRNQYKEEFKSKHEIGLGFMSFFTKAVTTSLKEYKDINAAIDGDNIVHYDYNDIGIAVSTPKGLMVPVLRNTEKMSFLDIEIEISRLANKARDGKITLQEMQGGTFTITNGGVFGSMLSTPIINPPQSAILGMHNIVERPVAIEGKVQIRPIMYIALSYDHRIIDGKESVGFLCRVKECLENVSEHLMKEGLKKALNL